MPPSLPLTASNTLHATASTGVGRQMMMIIIMILLLILIIIIIMIIITMIIIIIIMIIIMWWWINLLPLSKKKTNKYFHLILHTRIV